MSKSGSGKSTKGGGSKAKGGSVKDSVSRTVGLQTTRNEHIMVLRAALREASTGKDRNVYKDFQATFGRYKKDDLEAEIEFFAGAKLPDDVRRWALELCKRNMEAQYEASGYGWDDGLKEEEFEDCSRFLVAKDKATAAPLAFLHFRFSLQGEIYQSMSGEPALIVYDLQVAEEAQRKGLGKRMMQLCELMANKTAMQHVMFRMVGEHAPPLAFIQGKLKGYEADKLCGCTEDEIMAADADGESEFLVVHSKAIKPKVKPLSAEEKAQKDEVMALAQQIAQQLDVKKDEEAKTETDGQPAAPQE